MNSRKYATRNNSNNSSGGMNYRKGRSQPKTGRKKTYDVVDMLGVVISNSYEDREIPSSGDLEHLVQALDTQADKYHHHHNNGNNNNNNSSSSNYNSNNNYYQVEDEYEQDDYEDDDEANEYVIATSKSRLKSGAGKSPGRRSTKYDYEKENNIDECIEIKAAAAASSSSSSKYDREFINEAIAQKGRERSLLVEGRVGHGHGHGHGRGDTNGFSSEKVYTIFDAIIRTYGDYSREVGTMFVDTALKLTNRQIDSLACVKMLQSLFRDSPEIVHLFFDLVQSEQGPDGREKKLTLDERVLFGQKTVPQHNHPHTISKPTQKYSSSSNSHPSHSNSMYSSYHHSNQPPPSAYPYSAPPPQQMHHHYNPQHQHQHHHNPQYSRERSEVLRFLRDVKDALDLGLYQRFLDCMLEMRVIYKDKRYNLLEMKMNQLFNILGSRNDLKVQLEKLYPVSKIVYGDSSSSFGYPHQHQHQHQLHQNLAPPSHMHMMYGFDQIDPTSNPIDLAAKSMNYGNMMMYPGAQMHPSFPGMMQTDHLGFPSQQGNMSMPMPMPMPMPMMSQQGNMSMPMPMPMMPQQGNMSMSMMMPGNS